jgi:hypothetical protein
MSIIARVQQGQKKLGKFERPLKNNETQDDRVIELNNEGILSTPSISSNR